MSLKLKKYADLLGPPEKYTERGVFFVHALVRPNDIKVQERLAHLLGWTYPEPGEYWVCRTTRPATRCLCGAFLIEWD